MGLLVAIGDKFWVADVVNIIKIMCTMFEDCFNTSNVFKVNRVDNIKTMLSSIERTMREQTEPWQLAEILQ